MARTKHTYSVRLAVEGGGKVKAELIQVGDAGDRSFKKIETSSGKASRGLLGLGERTKVLGIGIRALGGALAGVATVGGLSALVDRSISAADAIGKTADKIGIGVEALQELRYAAQLAGIEERTLDMALQRFTRRAAEAAKGTGESKDALAQMGIALRDQSGRIRATEDLLGDVAEAFKEIQDPAERVRLAFKLFDSEGVAMVNMLADGADGLEEMRARARDLGIVLEEDLIRNAEQARDQLDTLGKVISANLTRAVLDLAPVIADASTGLAEFAKDAGVAYEQLKLLSQGDTNFEGLSLRSTKAVVEDLRDDVRGLRAERDALGDGIIDDLRRRWVEWRLDRKSQALQQWQAKLAWLQRDADKAKKPGPAPVDITSTPDTIEAQTKSAEDRARRLTKIENDLQRQLFQTTHQGAERIKAEHNKLVEELRSLDAPDGSDTTKIETMIERSAALRDARLAQLGEQERQAAEKRREANDKVLEGLRAEREQLILTDRERFVGQALQRLSTEATDEQRRAVEEHAGALYDEREALEARDRMMQKGRSLTESLRTESEKVAAAIAELNDLFRAGAIDQETYARAMEQTRDRMLRTSREWTDGVKRALRDYADEATDAARAAEEVTATALQGMEDALVQFASTGKVEFQSLTDSIMADITRIAFRQSITGPLASVLGSPMGGGGGGLFGGGGDGGLFGAGAGGPSSGGGSGLFAGALSLFGLFHEGGVIGEVPKAVRPVDPALFADAPRFHSGGFAGMGLLPDEIPIIARKGELVVPPERIVREETRQRDGDPISVVINVHANDANSFRASQGQIAAEMARAVDRARRNM